jgi:hypothetical protein
MAQVASPQGVIRSARAEGHPMRSRPPVALPASKNSTLNRRIAAMGLPGNPPAGVHPPRGHADSGAPAGNYSRNHFCPFTPRRGCCRGPSE